MKHEGWDEVTSVPTSRNLESRIGTNQHASAKGPPTEGDARIGRSPAGGAGLLGSMVEPCGDGGVITRNRLSQLHDAETKD